ncbi:MAG: acyloxyacyl hydrolase [Desulfuromonadaceae bacterium]|nr:acyloxyacyl hydrolase [Desulfuromonadaceae bacterium]
MHGLHTYRTTPILMLAILQLSMLLLILLCTGRPAASAPLPNSLLLGGGVSHVGLGSTDVDVQTLDLIPRWQFPRRVQKIGPLALEHSFLLETPVSQIRRPVHDLMLGLNFLACWRWQPTDAATAPSPYVALGGGPLYTAADIPGLGAELNGSWQIVLGVQLPGTQALAIEYRYHHISNGGRKDPNHAINSSKLLLGMHF